MQRLLADRLRDPFGCDGFPVSRRLKRLGRSCPHWVKAQIAYTSNPMLLFGFLGW
jgi:hypothetical protein